MFNKFALFAITLATLAVAHGSGHSGFSNDPSLSAFPSNTLSVPHTPPSTVPTVPKQHSGHKGSKARRLGRGEKRGSHKSGHGGNNGGLGVLGRSHNGGGHNGSKGSSSGSPSNGPVKQPGSSQPDPVYEAAGVAGGVSKSLTRRDDDDTETELKCTAGSLTCCMSASTTTDYGTRQLLASMNIDTKKLVGPYIGTLCRDANMDGTQCLDNLQPLCCQDYYSNGTAVNCIDPRNISGSD